MTYYYPTVRLAAYIDANNIISPYGYLEQDVVGDIVLKRGMTNDRPDTRVASPGQMTFTLRNDQYCSGGVEFYYTPGHANSRENWGLGNVIDLEYTVDATIYKFKGIVTEVDQDLRGQTVDVTVSDPIAFLQKNKLPIDYVIVNDESNRVFKLIMRKYALTTDGDYYSIDPFRSEKPYDTTSAFKTLSVIFDNDSKNRPALSEIEKMTMSEMGFFYIGASVGPDMAGRRKMDVAYESRLWRDGVDITSQEMPNHPDVADNLVTEAGDFLVTEAGDYIVLDGVLPAVFDGDYLDAEYTYGHNVFNSYTVNMSQYYFNTIAEIVGTYPSEIVLLAGQELTFRFYYQKNGRDVNVNQFTAIDIVAFTGPGGTGTNISLSIAYTHSALTSNYQDFKLKNNNAATAYVIPMVFYGKAIDKLPNLTALFEDQSSIDKYTRKELVIDMPYVDCAPGNEAVCADGLKQLEMQTKDPRNMFESIEFYANDNPLHFQASGYLDVGSQIKLRDPVDGTYKLYYIDYLTMTIKQGGITKVNWKLRENLIMTA